MDMKIGKKSKNESSPIAWQSLSATETGSSTEEMMNLEEDLIRAAAQEWLSLHGTKLFQLEVSKWLSFEKARLDKKRTTPLARKM